MPVCGEHLRARHHAEDLLHHAVGARVAIVPRIIGQRAVRAQQGEIHAPGIDADAIEPQLAFPPGDGQAALDLVPQPQRVPIKRVEHAHRRVGEAVQFFDFQPAAIEGAQHGASAFRAQVESQIV